uniref:Uncharacterized protein n=1 Tax=Romanomermis culicivorax TaxID=13658 RepID=A0A915JGV7_ROMCU
MPSDKIRHLKSEMAWLTAHIAQLTTQQMAPAPRKPMSPTQPSVQVQNADDHPSGAHLQMCSYHGCCTHNDTSCWAQHPNSASLSNSAATGAGRCYFCRMRVHLTH